MCETARQPYKAPFWCTLNGHIETILAAFVRRKPDIKYFRQFLTTPFQGTLALDWEDSTSTKNLPKNAPVVVLIPGLTGNSDDSYVRWAAQTAANAGYRPVVFNHKGGDGLPITIPELYSASYTEDIRFAMSNIKTQYPTAPMLACGWSLGANVLLRYLGEEGNDSPLTAAVSLCNPFTLDISMRRIESGLSRIYDLRLGSNLQSFITQHKDLFSTNPKVDLKRALKGRTIREFDIAITAPAFGWPSVDAYYKGSGSCHSVPHITTPLLCVQAADDPMAPLYATPIQELAEKDKCMVVVTPKGGHLGWITTDIKTSEHPWTDTLVAQYFTAVLQWEKNQQEKQSQESALAVAF